MSFSEEKAVSLNSFVRFCMFLEERILHDAGMINIRKGAYIREVYCKWAGIS